MKRIFPEFFVSSNIFVTGVFPLSTATATPQLVVAEKTNWRRRYPGLARFTRNKIAVISFVGIIVIFLIALLGPPIYGVDPSHINEEFMGRPEGPSSQFPLGVDDMGRDVLARVLSGARISLAVGVISCIINIIIGVGVGVVSGWCHGSKVWLVSMVDTCLMRVVDILYSMPLLLMVIMMQVFAKPLVEEAIHGIFGVTGRQNIPLLLSPDLVSIYLALGVRNWLTMARLARGEVLNQVEMDYVMASRSLGQKNIKILFRHIVPNCLGPLIVVATLAIPEAIFVESYLAFVGLGVTAPQASWGTMAKDGLDYINSAPHLLLAPAIAISLTMLAFNLFGDGLRDALDPSSSK